MAANINGLIYYKLDANVHGYPGDITKNCGLRGEEIDGNFNFLRGNDIKEISFDENGTIYLERYNGEIMSAKPTDTPNYDFNYNPESGSLTIVTPDGKEIVLTGFKVTPTIYHNGTLEGNGLVETPLEVSNLTRPGRYRPAVKLIDTTVKDENGNYDTLPTNDLLKHDRYVTKEKVNRFGRLYPLSGVEKISKRLEEINSEWHVPSKAEWDKILNEIDCAKPTHDKEDSNVELGEFAGAVLKSTKYWEKSNGVVLSDDAYGFSIHPVGYCGNRGKNYYGSFGLSTAFWTSTEEDNHKDMFVKKFEYDKETVGQQTWGENYYLSLRLVKKFTGSNFFESEHIDGHTVNCVHIPGTALIWTSENIGFSQEQYDGFAPEKWEEYEEASSEEKNYVIRHYVNDWNGNGWDKHEIKEGESIVLYESENGRMHEWVLVDGEMTDSSLIFKKELEEEINNFHNRLDEEIANRIEGDEQLLGGLLEEVKNRSEADSQLQENIDTEAEERKNADNTLQENINAEIEARTNADNKLQEAIDAEIEERKNADNKLQENIDTETEERIENDERLLGGLLEEVKNRTEADSQLQEAINKETEERKNADYKLQVTIDAEIEERIENDEQLLGGLLEEVKNRTEADSQLQENIDTEAAKREQEDAHLQQQISENRVITENDSIVIVPGETNNEETKPTTIRVNLDDTCEHLKLGDNGIYFDGYFGQF